MLLCALLRCSVSTDFRTLLEGEWTISAGANSLYAIAFHRAAASRSVLNATLWRNDVPPSASFKLTESPLLAQLQFSFSGARAGAVASIYPSSAPLCDFSFTGRGAQLNASATINGSALTVSFESGEFSLTFGDYGAFQVRKAPLVSIPKTVKKPAPGAGGTNAPFALPTNIPAMLIFGVVVLLAQFILWRVIRYFWRLCRLRAARRKGKKTPKPKKE
jgi:hypothetical protein